MLRGNHIGQQVGKPNRALNRSVMATLDRTNNLHGVTAAAVAARTERIQLCHLKKWRLWRRKGTLAGYTTNRMVRNNRGRRSWEVFGNVNRATFRWNDHPCCLESFDRVYPRPATPCPSSYPHESVPDLPISGLSPKDADKFRDVARCASPWLHNQRKSMSQLVSRLSARRRGFDAAYRTIVPSSSAVNGG